MIGATGTGQLIGGEFVSGDGDGAADVAGENDVQQDELKEDEGQARAAAEHVENLLGAGSKF